MKRGFQGTRWAKRKIIEKIRYKRDDAFGRLRKRKLRGQERPELSFISDWMQQEKVRERKKRNKVGTFHGREVLLNKREGVFWLGE